ncbi:hypothetical protein Pst134EA_026013 [Puccinia striiformis f. sp. tritici]|uniref:hypothetical protein n=1 Tax=Puccinia striiformis f. sp. tritici TaxID=168172 RepID=UPI002008168A|nr:hypothetical protein Pst134EA_026013 [Puccinia striiformis f. sp. tritici]KAH9452078.1 hypothetical protein Pst134EA_026013 [Puccinia striiformis f. sp. tritici]
MADARPRPPLVRIVPQDQELRFDGTNVELFLQSYQAAAQSSGASEYDMARQLCRFIKDNKVYQIVKTYDGYVSHDWAKLRSSLMDFWGQDDFVQFTLQDLEDLLQFWSKKEDILAVEDYPIFCESFELIVSYFLRNDNISTEEISNLCYQAFSRVLRCSLYRSKLVSNDFLIRPKVNSQHPVNSTTCSEPPSTQIKEALSKEALESNCENLGVDSDLLNQSNEELSPVVGSLDKPILLPGHFSSPPSNSSAKKITDLNHLAAYEQEAKKMQFLHSHNQLIEVGMIVVDSSRPLHPIQPEIKAPDNLGEDHNHFVDRLDVPIRSLDISPPIPNICSPRSQETSQLQSSTQHLDLKEHSNTHHICDRTSVPLNLKASRSNPILSSNEYLRDENKLPLFYFEEKDISFSDLFSVFQSKRDQDFLFQDVFQDFPQDSAKPQDQIYQEQLVIIEDINKIPIFLNLISPQVSLKPFLDSLSQENYAGSFIILFPSISEADLSFVHRRTGVGSNPLLTSEDHLRNEDKLQSFLLENLAPISCMDYNRTIVKLEENRVYLKILMGPFLAGCFFLLLVRVERFYPRGGTSDQK